MMGHSRHMPAPTFGKRNKQSKSVKDIIEIEPLVWPAALGLGRPGAAPAGLVQPCPKPWALFHKPF